MKSVSRAIQSMPAQRRPIDSSPPSTKEAVEKPDCRLTVSQNGSAIARLAAGEHGANEGIELWIDGTFWQQLELVKAPRSATNRVNRLASSHPKAPLQGWILKNSAHASCGINVLPEWTLTGQDTAYLHSKEAGAGAVFECPIEGQRLTAIPGEAYHFSGLFGIHRCSGRVLISFLDAGSSVLDVWEAEVPTAFEGGRSRSGYAEIVISGNAPARASAITIEIHKGPTLCEEDSFLFFAAPVLVRGETHLGSGREPITFPPEVTAAIFAGSKNDATILFPIWPSFLTRNGGQKAALVDQVSGTHFEVSGYHAAFENRPALQIHGLEGAVIVSQVIRVPSDDRAVTLEIWVDGALTATKTLPKLVSGDIVRCPLPSSACDGRPHLFQIRDHYDCHLLGQFADLGPDSLTPWTSLQQYSGSPLPIERAPAMEHRYRGLRQGLRGLASADGLCLEDLTSRLQALIVSHDLVVEGFERTRRRFPPLAFPAHAAPRVSVVIPVHDKFEVTYNCLASLLLAHNETSFDVVLVDDGSSDETVDLADFVRNITFLRNETALGFVGACNRGAQAARGEFIVFLNNDTEPTAGWLDELLFAFDVFDDVGLAGSKLLYGDGRLQEAGGIVWESGDPSNYGRGDNPRETRFCYTREVDYLSGASIMISRTLWEDLGGFSQEFAPAYFEDTDLAFKVKAAGKRVVFTPFSIVYHFEGLSNGTNSSSTGLKRFQEINRPKFKRRWQKLFRGNGKIGVDVNLVKDRGITLRAVLFDIETPRLDNDAGSYAAIQEIRLLQSLGFKVTFVPSNLAYLGRHTHRLQRMGVEVIYAPYAQSLEQFIEARATEFDLVYVTRYQIAHRVTDLIRRVAPSVPILCNVADLHFLRDLREAALETMDPERTADLERRREEELNALSKTDLILTYSPIEQAVMTSHYVGRNKVALLPWVLDPSAAPPPFSEREGLAFLGGFSHSPNHSAVEFFIREVMPLVRERLPGTPFRVYGSNIPESLLKLAAKDVIFEGYISDVKVVFDRCRVFVAPLRFGAGVKGKVLDCIAAGVPAVLSLAAAEALPLAGEREVLIAERPEQWVNAIASLYTDEARWAEMSKAMLSLAKRAFTFEHGREMMSAALEQVNLYTAENRRALCVKRARTVEGSLG